MGIVFRQSVKSAIVTFSGAVLGTAVMYLSARYLPKQELGFFRNTLPEQALLLAQILLLGLHSTLSVYIHRFPPGHTGRPALLGISFIIPVSCLLLLLPFYYLFQEQIIHFFQSHDQPMIRLFYSWLPVYTFFFICLLLLEQYLISQMKVALALFMREVVFRILLLSLILLYGFGAITFNTLLPASVLIYIVPVFLLFFFSRKTGSFQLSWNWTSIPVAEKKEIAHFTWYHFLLSFSLNLLNKLDIILIAMWAGLSAGAVYGIAVYILSFLYIPYRTMINASLPVLTKAYQAGQKEEVRDIYSRSSLNILVAVVGLALLIGSNIQHVPAIFKGGFEDVVPLVFILLIGRLAEMATGMSEQLLSISNYYRFSFFLSLSIVLLIFAGNYLLIPRYGYFGAAWATTAALVVYSISKTLYINARLQLRFFSKHTLYILLAGTLAGLVAWLIPSIKYLLLDVAVRSASVLLVYVGLLLWLKPAADLNTYLVSVIKNKRLF